MGALSPCIYFSIVIVKSALRHHNTRQIPLECVNPTFIITITYYLLTGHTGKWAYGHNLLVTSLILIV